MLIDLFVESMDTPCLAANDRPCWDMIFINGSATSRNIAWLRHRYRREAPQAFLDYSIQIWELINCLVFEFRKLLEKHVLDVPAFRHGELVHQEAQRVASGVDSRSKMIHALSGHLNLTKIVLAVLELVYQSLLPCV